MNMVVKILSKILSSLFIYLKTSVVHYRINGKCLFISVDTAKIYDGIQLCSKLVINGNLLKRIKATYKK